MGATRPAAGGGVKFDSRSQLAASIQDALGGQGEGRGRRASLYPEGTTEQQSFFLFAFHLQGGKKRDIR